MIITRQEGRAYVYLVSPKGKNVYKIGETIDIQVRFAQKEKQKDYKLELVSFVEVERGLQWEIEHRLHDIYSRYRLAGEWFALEQDAVDGFATLAASIEKEIIRRRK